MKWQLEKFSLKIRNFTRSSKQKLSFLIFLKTWSKKSFAVSFFILQLEYWMEKIILQQLGAKCKRLNSSLEKTKMATTLSPEPSWEHFWIEALQLSSHSFLWAILLPHAWTGGLVNKSFNYLLAPLSGLSALQKLTSNCFVRQCWAWKAMNIQSLMQYSSLQLQLFQHQTFCSKTDQ